MPILAWMAASLNSIWYICERLTSENPVEPPPAPPKPASTPGPPPPAITPASNATMVKSLSNFTSLLVMRRATVLTVERLSISKSISPFCRLLSVPLIYNCTTSSILVISCNVVNCGLSWFHSG
ncbi:MAG TPA: hypothetical protein DEH25_00120 [Chloroflexi bacterium]|nr:hypothetical protein [Chloroflexota bacterium]